MLVARSHTSSAALVTIAAIVCFLFSIPQAASAGSQTYSSPGSYSFTVPSYGTLTVTANGAGGGAGAYGYNGPPTLCTGGSGGQSGAASYFSSVRGNGGGGGSGDLSCSAYVGSPGTASGGDTNTSGGGSAGGVAGAAVRSGYKGPYSGGAGGRAVKTYASGALTPGAVVTVVVGSGGSGGSESYGTAGASGSAGSVTITWTTPAPTCSINASPTTINQPSGSSLTWTSANATTFYITNIGYVTANVSSGATVYPSATITYSGTATGAGGTGNCSRIVTVNRSCTFNGSTVLHGASVTAYQASSVPYGNSCTSQTRTCSDGTLSGTYAYASCSVTPAANCTFNGNTVLHGGSVTAYQASTVPYGSSCTSQSRSCSNGTLSGTYAYTSCSVTPAANCTLDGATVLHGASDTFYTQQTAPVGQTCSAISQSRMCTNGTLSGTASYQYASCVCAPIYSCSGNNIQYTNAACSTSTVVSCTSPGFCTAGQSSCQYNPISFVPFTGISVTGSNFSASGHLEVRPGLVREDATTRIYWSTNNAQSCTVTGSNGDSWNVTSSPTSGYTSAPITAQTTYTLNCTAYPSATPASVSEAATVLLSPAFKES